MKKNAVLQSVGAIQAKKKLKKPPQSDLRPEPDGLPEEGQQPYRQGHGGLQGGPSEV